MSCDAPTVEEIQTHLAAAHGEGSWETATEPAPILEEGATPWPGLYVGYTYDMRTNDGNLTRRGTRVSLTVEGYEGDWVYGTTGGAGGTFYAVNMNNVCWYYDL